MFGFITAPIKVELTEATLLDLLLGPQVVMRMFELTIVDLNDCID